MNGLIAFLLGFGIVGVFSELFVYTIVGSLTILGGMHLFASFLACIIAVGLLVRIMNGDYSE